MKKTLFVLIALSSILISGCANFSAPPASNQTKKVNKIIKKPRPVRKTHGDGFARNQTKISLNDFTDLSLNNSQPTSGNLWEKIGTGLKIPSAENRPEVQEQIRWFMAHPSYLERTTERARPYLFIVYQEVKSRNLPTELVLLPINESAYYPFSYSSTGATGIWQLMPSTANDWGLKHTLWYDGRRDIFDSTNAALDYLTYLANYFNGDWLLAIAAYDTGEGNVQKAIARNMRDGLPTDFWSLRVSAETRSYVPRLLALAVILAHPDRYPLPLPPVDARPVVAPVQMDHQINLTDAAKLAGISVNQLKVLNPGLSRTTTDPDQEAKLLLPVDSIENFKANLSSIAPATAAPPAAGNFGHYRVQRGDTLQSIADRFSTSVDTLRQANNIFTRHVATGTVLLIPNVTDTFKPSTEINLDQTPLSLNSDSIAAVSTSKIKKSSGHAGKKSAHKKQTHQGTQKKPVKHKGH